MVHELYSTEVATPSSTLPYFSLVLPLGFSLIEVANIASRGRRIKTIL